MLRFAQFFALYCRFQRCADGLRAVVGAEAGQSTASSSTNGRLAAVCGMLGDCFRGLGDYAQAVHHYREGCTQYDEIPQPTPQVTP
jgi:hypothetical protein